MITRKKSHELSSAIPEAANAKEMLVQLTQPIRAFFYDQRKKRHVAEYGHGVQVVMDF